MNTSKSEKSTGPRSYNAVRPPANQTPGSRAAGSKSSGGMQARTASTQGRGSFSGSPPMMGGYSCDWGSPHKTRRIPSTGRD